MPTELEELIEFIHHGNTPIRQLAVENSVPYSLSQPSIFKTNHLQPITDLKLLIRDYTPIAKNALTILINLSADTEILRELASDTKFVHDLLSRLVRTQEKNVNLIAMLLANLAKYDDLKKIITAEGPTTKELTSPKVMDQLMDCFVCGADGAYNADADYDYLAYLFADISKHAEGREYFITKQAYDGVIPITKLTVFTEHKSNVRRKGVASTIKNVAFDIPTHPAFLNNEEINILPYLLLPLMGSEEFAEEDMLDMLPDLQLLPPDKMRDADASIMQTHVETLMLLTTTREGRDLMREIRVYPIIRELHLQVEDEDVREACERLVQVLMRDEEGEVVKENMKALRRLDRPSIKAASTGTAPAASAGSWHTADVDSEIDDDDDDEITEV